MALLRHNFGQNRCESMDTDRSHNPQAAPPRAVREPAGRMRVLVCDDERVQQKLLKQYLAELDIPCRIVGTGEDAVAAVEAEDFDLVLMDRVLPGIDGLEAIRRIRQLLHKQAKWTPLVLLTSLASGSDVVDGLQAGADDYLIKPVSFDLFRAKLQVFIRLSLQERLLREKSEALTRYRDLAEREKDFGTHVLAAMTRRAELRDPELQVWQRAADQLSGDLIAYRRTPDARYLLLADAMGHGLSAAFATILAADLFYAMTAKRLPIADIAVELNRKLASVVPPGFMVSGVLVRTSAGGMQVINAGMPAVSLLRGGCRVHEFQSINLPFAVQRDDWQPVDESFACQPGDRLVAMTDGLTETLGDALDRIAGEADIVAYLDAEVPPQRKIHDDATVGVLTL